MLNSARVKAAWWQPHRLVEVNMPVLTLMLVELNAVKGHRYSLKIHKWS